MIEKINENDALAVKKAQALILNDGIVCFKSDTVYGFACNALSDAAVQGLYKLKKRSVDKPVAIFAKDINMARKIFQFDDFMLQICDKYLPGQITFVAKTKINPEFIISKKLNLESNFLGFRIIDNLFVNELISCLGFPLAVTSANISDSRELLSGYEISEVFKGYGDDFLLIDGGKCSSGDVSTVTKVCDGKLEILRQGIIKID